MHAACSSAYKTVVHMQVSVCTDEAMKICRRRVFDTLGSYEKRRYNTRTRVLLRLPVQLGPVALHPFAGGVVLLLVVLLHSPVLPC